MYIKTSKNISIKNIFSKVCFFVQKSFRIPTPAVTILGYHAVSQDDTLVDITPTAFAEQIEYMLEQGYVFISLTELQHARQNSTQFSHPVAVLTFDDGYEDLLHFAAPYLAERNIPATYFVVSHPERINRLKLQNNKPIAQGKYLKRLAEFNGADIGAHTVGHVDVTQLTPDELMSDCQESRCTLQETTKKPIQHFAYPWGRSSRVASEIISAQGFATAVTTQIGFANNTDSSFQLPRIMVDRTHSLVQFKFMLTPLYPVVVSVLATVEIGKSFIYRAYLNIQAAMAQSFFIRKA